MRKELIDRINHSDTTQIDLKNLKIEDKEIKDLIDEIKNAKPKTEEIYLSHNYISDKGAAILAKELATLDALSFIDLQFNQLEKEGIETIFTLKKTHPGLRIALHGNKMTDAFEMHQIEQKYE